MRYYSLFSFDIFCRLIMLKFIFGFFKIVYKKFKKWQKFFELNIYWIEKIKIKTNIKNINLRFKLSAILYIRFWFKIIWSF